MVRDIHDKHKRERSTQLECAVCRAVDRQTPRAGGRDRQHGGPPGRICSFVQNARRCAKPVSPVRSAVRARAVCMGTLEGYAVFVGTRSTYSIACLVVVLSAV